MSDKGFLVLLDQRVHIGLDLFVAYLNTSTTGDFKSSLIQLKVIMQKKTYSSIRRKLLKESNRFRNLEIGFHLLLHNELDKRRSVLNSRSRHSGCNIVTNYERTLENKIHEVSNNTVASTFNTRFLDRFHKVS